MTLLLTMLPVYLFGNLHCMGMCGPLVMLLGASRYRHLYFLGRLCSFTLAGLIAGGAGSLITVVLAEHHISSIFSLSFGLIIAVLGLNQMTANSISWLSWNLSSSSGLVRYMNILITRDQPLAIFLFGFCTIFLPCGQTVIVYAACALSASASTGLLNGFVFALLTSPSLWLAMKAHKWLGWNKKAYERYLGFFALVAGTLACLRGLAELELIQHLIVNPHMAREFHIVIY